MAGWVTGSGGDQVAGSSPATWAGLAQPKNKKISSKIISKNL